jgi:hypothetical protein
MSQYLAPMTDDEIKDRFAKALSLENRQQGDPLAKVTTVGTTQTTNLTWYDLQNPAKNLFPVLTPIRNETPRVSGQGGTATNWKAVTAINATGLQAFVPEGVRNGVISTTTLPKTATYSRQGLENYVTWEADLAAKSFEDVRATQGQRTLWSLMIQEERNILGANSSVALAIPTGLTVTPVATGGHIIDDAGGYDVYVVALTFMGMQVADMTNGVVQQVSVTPADGSSAFLYGGGSSDHSAKGNSGAVSSSGGNIASIQMYCTIVTGACGYAWYVGAHGDDCYLQAITPTNSFLLETLIASGQKVTAITGDYSENTNGFDGLLYQAWTTASGAYIKSMSTGVPGTGTALSSNSAGGITEIDDMLYSLYSTIRLTPAKLWVSAYDMKKNIIPLLFGGAANGTLRQNISLDNGANQREVIAGFTGVKYHNPYGFPVMDIVVHPDMPRGTMHALTYVLPYPINNVPNVFEMKLRRDYWMTEWPQRTAKYEFGVNIYAPFSGN